jgi:hypothetical protein
LDNDVAAAQELGKATIDIEGSENKVSLWQVGNNVSWNVADVDVVGSLNMINVDQRSNGNNADVNILGSSNTATVTQSGF